MSGGTRVADQQIAFIGCVPEPKSSDGIFPQSPLFKIGERHGFTLVGIEQLMLEVLDSKVVDDIQGVCELDLSQLLRRSFYFLQFDAVFPGQPAQCFEVGEAFVFPEERYGIATLSTAETFKNIACGIDIERWRALSVKRTQAYEVHPAPFERDKFSDHVFNTSGVNDILDLLGWDHVDKGNTS